MLGLPGRAILVDVLERVLDDEPGRVVELVHAMERRLVVEFAGGDDMLFRSNAIPPQTVLNRIIK